MFENELYNTLYNDLSAQAKGLNKVLEGTGFVIKVYKCDCCEDGSVALCRNGNYIGKYDFSEIINLYRIEDELDVKEYTHINTLDIFADMLEFHIEMAEKLAMDDREDFFRAIKNSHSKQVSASQSELFNGNLEIVGAQAWISSVGSEEVPKVGDKALIGFYTRYHGFNNRLDAFEPWRMKSWLFDPEYNNDHLIIAEVEVAKTGVFEHSNTGWPIQVSITNAKPATEAFVDFVEQCGEDATKAPYSK